VANVSNCNFYNNASDTSAMSVGSEDPEEMEDPVEVEESEDLEDSEV
jgi:hypothetical protein